MNRLAGKVALITGAAGGIGAATAALFAREGAQVIAADMAEAATQAAVRAVTLDVTDEGAWRTAVADVVAREGGIDILINAAGIGGLSAIDSETRDGWERVIAVNQTGTFLGMRQVIPVMKRRNGGAIVNISSVFGMAGVPGAAAYHASKGAVYSLTKNGAITYAPDNIRVNAVHPGITNTAMTASVGDEMNAETLSRTPLRRMAEPIEIANGILFLASDEASYVTGVGMAIDGGYLAY